MTRIYSRLYLLLAFTLFFTLGSCDKYNQETANGFKYFISHKGTGEQVTYGSYAYTWFSISTGDSVLFSTEQPEGKRIRLRDPNNFSVKINDPVLDVLPLLHVGDTANVIVEVDDLMRLTKDLKDVENLFYTVSVMSIESKEERREANRVDQKRRTTTRKDLLQRKSLEMQETKDGGMAYQKLRTAIASYHQNPDYKESTTGLGSIILNKGKMPLCKTDDQVSVHYIGMQEESLVFDETYSSDKPFIFTLDNGRVIKAWDEGVQMLGVGGEAFFKVPAALGYGASGYEPLIKPNTTIYFYVKVLSSTNG